MKCHSWQRLQFGQFALQQNAALFYLDEGLLYFGELCAAIRDSFDQTLDLLCRSRELAF